MAVKTITIDMEAYDMLAAEKKGNESFSKVIKRHFGRAATAADLLERLDDICLSEDALRQVGKVVASRKKSVARSPKL